MSQLCQKIGKTGMSDKVQIAMAIWILSKAVLQFVKTYYQKLTIKARYPKCFPEHS